jgi:hypothetical protein
MFPYVFMAWFIFSKPKDTFALFTFIWKSEGNVIATLNYAPRAEDVCGSSGTAPLDGIKWSVSRPDRLTQRKELPVSIV